MPRKDNKRKQRVKSALDQGYNEPTLSPASDELTSAREPQQTSTQVSEFFSRWLAIEGKLSKV